MDERIEKELILLRTTWPDLEYRPDGRWVRIPGFRLPSGWNIPAVDVAFQIPVGYPGAPPYGIHVPAGLRFNGQQPTSYTEAVSTPFQGTWGKLSWTPEAWCPTVDLVTGSNLRNWVFGFADRFREGR